MNWQFWGIVVDFAGVAAVAWAGVLAPPPLNRMKGHPWRRGSYVNAINLNRTLRQVWWGRLLGRAAWIAILGGLAMQAYSAL